MTGDSTHTDRQPAFGPLHGIRVLDITVAFAGAFATMFLADLGAEIIKIDSLQHYSTPSRGPRRPVAGNAAASMSASKDYPDADPGDEPWDRTSWFNSHARNKRDVTMDLTRPRGRELFLRLVEQSDGLIENNPPGLLEKLGLGHDELLARNPRMIVVRMPPLGLWGPDARTTGFGWHFEDLGGLLRVQGYPDGPDVGSIFMDAASGPAGANAFLMALLRRQRSGTGGLVEIAQVENLVNHIGDFTTAAAMTGEATPRWGNRSPSYAPQGCYRCAGDDAWVVLSVRDDAEWAALVDLLDDDALERPDLADLAGRHAAHDELDVAISRWTGVRSAMDAAIALQAIGLPAGPVLTEADAMSDPQLHERGFFVLLDHPKAGTHFHPGANFQLRGTPTQIWRAAPTLGQDNDDVYRDLLGVSDEEYAELEADGHIGTTFV